MQFGHLPSNDTAPEKSLQQLEYVYEDAGAGLKFSDK